jgi:hypothetical protein
MDEFTFFKLMREYVTPSEIEDGGYQLLIEALLPLDKTAIEAFNTRLYQHIDKILPNADEYEKEDLLYVSDVALTMQTATIGPKGGEKKLLTEVLGFKS